MRPFFDGFMIARAKAVKRQAVSCRSIKYSERKILRFRHIKQNYKHESSCAGINSMFFINCGD